MEVTRDDVLRCARLAHLSLRDEEIEPMRVAMTQVLSHAEALDELALDGVEPTLQALPVRLPRREDVVVDTFTQAQALANAPATDRGFFVVPKVM
jgi:aspartyl-tRNA(Asn)/glutamyl-tRNA(Gln) amidotransferase subunit C